MTALMQKGIDWEDAVQEAERARAGRMLRFGLLLAHRLFGIQLPERIAGEIQADRVTKKAARKCEASLLRPADAPAPYGERIIALRLEEGIGAKIRYLFRTLTCLSQSDLMAVRLPPRLSFFYYLIRPVRLLRDVVRARRSRPAR